MPAFFAARKVSFRHLKQLNLELQPGQRLGLTGPSGAGKTLLLRALADLEPHDGDLSLNGVDARHLPAPKWRRQVALLPSESAWWHPTVGPHFETADAALLNALGLADGVLEWPVERLSSGERQRLALARMLATAPKVMLLDEPTANLDEANAARVEDLLTRLCETRRMGAIWVSHDLDQLTRLCDPVLTLDGSGLSLMMSQKHQGHPSVEIGQ